MYSHYCRALRSIHIPRQTSRTTSTFSKAVGDISSVFPSLSGSTIAPLPPRFADIKLQIVQRNAAQLQESWTRLLSALEKEKQAIKAEGSKVVPEIRFNELNDMGQRTAFRDRLRKRGVAVVRGVVSEQEALGWKELLERYIASNPQVRGRSMPYVASISSSVAAAAIMKLRILRFISYHPLIQTNQGFPPPIQPSTSFTGRRHKSSPAPTPISCAPSPF